MTAESRTQHLLPGCDPRPARACRCVGDMPCQDPGEAARCAKCGLRLSPKRALSVGALPELDEPEASADAPTAEGAEDPPHSASRGPGPVALDPEDGRPRRNGQATRATARPLGPGSPQPASEDAA